MSATTSTERDETVKVIEGVAGATRTDSPGAVRKLPVELQSEIKKKSGLREAFKSIIPETCVRRETRRESNWFHTVVWIGLDWIGLD
jgi:hypothetical protein